MSIWQAENDNYVGGELWQYCHHLTESNILENTQIKYQLQVLIMIKYIETTICLK